MSPRRLNYLSVLGARAAFGADVVNLLVVSTGRHFPPGHLAAAGWSQGRTPPSRPAPSLSVRRSGWWRGAPSWAWGGWAAATELGAERRRGECVKSSARRRGGFVTGCELTVYIEACGAGHDAGFILC